MKYRAAAVLVAFSGVAEARVDYAIDLTAPEHHTGQVSIAFPRAAGPYLDVKMPAWRTGRYQILNLANGVRAFKATDAQGRPLRWQKVDKSTWRIHLGRPGAVRVGYELYGRELGLRTRHIDDSHAYLNPSAVFMYADHYRADDVTVSLNVPAGWNSHSGMPSTAPHRFTAANWDVLTDSPIETGINRTERFTEGGRQYEVTFWGDGNYDAPQIAADLKKIVATAPSIWSGYPFQRYLFIIHAADGASGATEHRNSTVIQIPRYNFQPRAAYLGFLSTASHEFVHTWNVKAYRPVGLVPYDFQRENYSDLLWVAEGSTDYFSDHLLLRAGVSQPSDYFNTLSNAIAAYQRTPGARIQSVAEASFDEWISVGGDRGRNAQAGIYSEGLLVSWLLDIALLERTAGRVSYRDVHEAIYRRYSADRVGFTAADMRGILRELTGQSWDEWWQQNVDKPAVMDFDRLLAPVGLRLAPSGARIAWAGWTGEEFVGGVRLSLVERDGPAWKAGFTPEDIIVAIDGKRATKARFDAIASEASPGHQVTVTYFRREALAEKTLTLSSIAKDPPKVVTIDQPTDAQKALFQHWLLIPYPGS